MSRAWIGLGSNLGDRLANIKSALLALSMSPGMGLVGISSIYDTGPVGREDQPRFLNAVAVLETELDPRELLDRLLEIERDHGRVRSERWGSRTLDLDLLVFEDTVMYTEHLTLPHPRMTERAFVLVPLAEISPDLVIPGTRECVAELLENLGKDVCDVRRLCGPPASGASG